MKLTLSVIKADIGSIGGHIRPSQALLDCVRQHVLAEKGRLLIDCYVSATGDDIALLMTHQHGVGAEAVHKLAWGAFLAGTDAAQAQRLQHAQSGREPAFLAVDQDRQARVVHEGIVASAPAKPLTPINIVSARATTVSAGPRRATS